MHYMIKILCFIFLWLSHFLQISDGRSMDFAPFMLTFRCWPQMEVVLRGRGTILGPANTNKISLPLGAGKCHFPSLLCQEKTNLPCCVRKRPTFPDVSGKDQPSQPFWKKVFLPCLFFRKRPTFPACFWEKINLPFPCRKRPTN